MCVLWIPLYLMHAHRLKYIVEYSKQEDRNRIPVDWILHSSTKKVWRYRPPSVRKKLEERDQYIERRAQAADEAFLSFLSEITQDHYAVLRDAVNKLAIADCLFSLATVAVSHEYVKPEFVEGSAESDDTLEILEGRHPMIEAIRDQPFIPNSVQLGNDAARCKVITGPNMGGKSSTVRMIALIAIMAQIGSYVPAKSVRLSMLDGILTRMGGAFQGSSEGNEQLIHAHASLCSLGRACSWPIDLHGGNV